jgi:hypothetical protein
MKHLITREPKVPKEFCHKCGQKYRDWECKVHKSIGPLIVVEGPKDHGRDNPVNCMNRRCVTGQKLALENLEEAIKKGKLVERKTKNGKVVRGADASDAKRGFVDVDGTLYVYEGHDPKSEIVIATGQHVKSPNVVPSRRLSDKELYGEKIWGVGAI